jgi:fluoride exporter
VFAHDNRELAAVFVGGAVGTLARAGLELLASGDPGRWPWPTFAANIVGAFLLGYFTTRLLERLPVSSYRRPLLGTGLCGGLTTFSTMQVETIRMLEHQHYSLALGYTAAVSARCFDSWSTARCRRGRAVGSRTARSR